MESSAAIMEAPAPVEPARPFLEVRGLGKAFGSERVLRDLSFHLEQGQTFAVLGRSGCGKTTLLKILAGLCDPDTGTLRLAGRSLAGVPPERRGVVYLYQEPLLFPHLDVFENVAFGLRLRRVKNAELRPRVEEMLACLELSGHAAKKPDPTQRRPAPARRVRPGADHQSDATAARRTLRQSRYRGARADAGAFPAGREAVRHHVTFRHA